MQRLARLAGLVLVPALCWGSPGEVKELGAHRIRGMDEFQQVIDSKCSICHTRERVDVAIRKRESLKRIEKQMVERGAILSENEKTVLGTFWGEPLKK